MADLRSFGRGPSPCSLSVTSTWSATASVNSLYWSVVSEWRKQRDRGALEAMRQKRPGRKGDPVRAENARLRARVGDLEGRLQVAEELICAQGKVSAPR